MLLTGLAGRVGLALLVAPESDVYYYLKDAAEALPQEDTPGERVQRRVLGCVRSLGSLALVFCRSREEEQIRVDDGDYGERAGVVYRDGVEDGTE